MNIVDIYNPYLKAINWFSDKDGFIRANVPGDTVGVTLKGVSLVLPTTEHLRNANKSKLAFHPLHENVVAKTNPLLDLVRVAMMVRVNILTLVVMNQLVRIAGNQALHKGLNPTQCEFLKLVPDVNPETVVLYDKLVEENAFPVNVPNQGFVSLFVKTGGVHKAVKYSKLAVVSFPVFEDINAEKPTLAKFKARDKKTLSAILKYIFPNIEEKGAYSFGSSNETAPQNTAIFGAYAQIANDLNKVIEVFKDKFENVEEMFIDLEIMDVFKDLNAVRALIHSIPIQDDCVQQNSTAQAVAAKPAVSGLAQKIEEAKANQVTSVAAPAVTQVIHQQQPIIQAPAQGKTMTFSELQQASRNNIGHIQQVQPIQQIQPINQVARVPGWSPLPGQINQIAQQANNNPSWLQPNSAMFATENRNAQMQQMQQVGGFTGVSRL